MRFGPPQQPAAGESRFGAARPARPTTGASATGASAGAVPASTVPAGTAPGSTAPGNAGAVQRAGDRAGASAGLAGAAAVPDEASAAQLAPARGGRDRRHPRPCRDHGGLRDPHGAGRRPVAPPPSSRSSETPGALPRAAQQAGERSGPFPAAHDESRGPGKGTAAWPIVRSRAVGGPVAALVLPARAARASGRCGTGRSRRRPGRARASWRRPRGPRWGRGRCPGPAPTPRRRHRSRPRRRSSATSTAGRAAAAGPGPSRAPRPASSGGGGEQAGGRRVDGRRGAAAPRPGPRGLKRKPTTSILDAFQHLAEHVVALALVFHQGVALGVGPQADAFLQVVHLVEVLAPLAVDDLQQHEALDLAHVRPA